MRYVLFVLIGGLLLWWLTSALYTVDRGEFVYVTEFGKPVATFDGAIDEDAGLHFKLPWPIQAVQRLDHRLQVLDLPGIEVVTPDTGGKTIDKTLTINAYVCWQIAGKVGVDQFIRTVGSPEWARTLLEKRVNSRLQSEISNMPGGVTDLISEAPLAVVEQRMDRLRDRLLTGSTGGDNLQKQIGDEYGIQIVDIRLRRFNHPPGVRSEIFTRIRSERYKKVADYNSDAERRAEDIMSAARREASDINTSALAEQERLQKQADVKADEIRNQAHRQDPEFYAFVQKLKAYQTILGQTKDVLLLSTRHELFDMLLKPPRANGTLSPGRVVGNPGTGKSGGP
jgi:membrane protease subunit HflC